MNNLSDYQLSQGSNAGPEPFLSSSEELKLSRFIKESAKVIYGKTRKKGMIIAVFLKTRAFFRKSG